jgi:cytoskeleton protein RodZ
MTDPGTIGARLKAERERRGLSPQKAADELHLDGWVIDALEADDYERIGPSVYAKGHLKRYAALLGLPAADIMAGYESRHQAPMPAASQPANNVRLRTGPPVVNDLPWPLIAGSVAVVLLAAGVLWWKPWQPRGVVPAASETLAANPSAASTDGATDSAAAMAGSAPPPLGSPAPAPSSPASSLPLAAPPSGAAAMPSTRAASSTSKPDAMAGMGRARLRLSFSADSWVDVHDAAGRRVFAGNGRANSVKTIAGVAPMRVYLGSASGVQLEINNRAVAIGPQFWAGDVARFEAGADGVLRRDSRVVETPGPGAATPAVATPGAAIPGAHPSG